jgi:hypothetical protein
MQKIELEDGRLLTTDFYSDEIISILNEMISAKSNELRALTEFRRVITTSREGKPNQTQK